MLYHFWLQRQPSLNTRHPVLFFIHGGGYINEYGALYGPKYFMDYGIVVVTINYRVGPFGKYFSVFKKCWLTMIKMVYSKI